LRAAGSGGQREQRSQPNSTKHPVAISRSLHVSPRPAAGDQSFPAGGRKMYHSRADTYSYHDYKSSESHGAKSRSASQIMAAGVRIQPAGLLDRDDFEDIAAQEKP
jgi:hypothetical protein